MRKRVIILGSSGFIGSWLLKRFSSEGTYEAVGFSSQDCNLLSVPSIQSALSDLNSEDVVILTAAIARIKENSHNSFDR